MEPLQYSFFLKGLFAGIAVAAACGILSGFIVWRGMAFIGDALAHAILPGIVLGTMFGVHMLIGALIAAIISVIAIGALTSHKGFNEDTAIGVIFAGAFALGLLLIDKVSGFKDLTHILFGNILGVSGFDLTLIIIVSVVVILMVILFYKELLVTSFDSTHALAIGLSPTVIHFGFYGSYYFDAPSGATIVMVLTILFIVAFLFSKINRRLKSY